VANHWYLEQSMRIVDAVRTRLELLFSRSDAEARMNAEMRFHIDMETERLVREQGLAPQEARRRAVIAFGIAEQHKDAMRDGRVPQFLRSFSGLSLDLKLGFRMLVKYPGLTLVGGLAMAFGIWAGAITHVMVGQFINPKLPLPGADRIVQLVNWDVEANNEEPRVLSDFLVWRDGLKSVTDLGAYRDVSRNLVVGKDAGRPVDVAEITATAFRIAPEPPLLGRVLTPADEQAGAAPVVVLGHELWRTRFASDPAVVGRTVQLGGEYATVVGVMREGYAFPVNHELWTPLKPDAIASGPREGPGIQVFGRLAPGATLEQAQAELATVGRRAATARPDTHAHLQPLVGLYARPIGSQSAEMWAILLSTQLFAVLLLVLVCSNVALLMFARAATREGELVVRSALGASRARIVAQLFAEALVLGGVAAVVGLAAAQFGLRQWGVEFLERNYEGSLPFWYDINVSPSTVVYAAALTVLGAAIAGVMPALKVTRGLGARLKAGTAGGGGLRFGGGWTAVIVTQVALTVAFPAIVFVEQRELARMQSQDPGFAVEEYLGVKLDLEPGTDSATYGARFAAAARVLGQRMAAEPGVTGVTFVDRLPQNYHRSGWVEVDAPAGPKAPGFWDAEASTASIDPSYFEVLKAPILAGRGFSAADFGPDSRVVIVDQGFVEKVLQGRNPIGQRIRLSSRSEMGKDPSRPWFEIIGVVKNLGMQHVVQNRPPAGVYMPRIPERDASVYMVVHAAGDPLVLGTRVRELAAGVDPVLRLTEVQRLDEAAQGMLWIVRLWLRLTLGLTAIAILLSLAGIYAVLSFTVARRTREIGVRVALGAPRARVIGAIFRKPLTQVAAGVAVGFTLVTVAAYLLVGHQPDGQPRTGDGLTLGHVALLVTHGVFMLGVCMLACVVPTRRALRVEPTEAMRADS
jgi:predicted permease